MQQVLQNAKNNDEFPYQLVAEFLSGPKPQLLDDILRTEPQASTYAMYAATNLLFVPLSIHGDPRQQVQNELRKSLDKYKSKNELVNSVYKESPFAYLELIRRTRPWSMFVLFHLSRLALHSLLPPHDLVASRLLTHQTIQLIDECSSLMAFDDWLPYVTALGANPEWQALAFVTLVSKKVDLTDVG